MTFANEMKATEEAKTLLTDRRVQVSVTNHAAWVFLRRVIARVDNRQQELFDAEFGKEISCKE